MKTPTLYFVDTGLACRLLRIETPSQLDTHPLLGALFQTWVTSELLKARVHRGLDSDLHFWRDRRGHEIDLLIGPDEALVPIEVKSGRTIPSDARRAIHWWTDLAGDSAGTGMVVYGGDASFTRAGVRHVGWRDLLGAL